MNIKPIIQSEMIFIFAGSHTSKKAETFLKTAICLNALMGMANMGHHWDDTEFTIMCPVNSWRENHFIQVRASNVKSYPENRTSHVFVL